jgi:K+-transporting ATPase ATPase C chain
MFVQIVRPSIIFLAVMTVLTGVVYPLLITGIAQVAFPHQAGGSLIYDGDRVVGSELIGQPFDDPKYFWSRPSATGPVPYNAAASSGSNLGPIEPNLVAAFKSRAEALRRADPSNTQPIPADLLTASSSGLDPHISPAAAEYQVARVAKARGLEQHAVRDLVARHTRQRTLGLLGEAHVNVLTLNLDLDRVQK